jgi:hypothetical protein
MKVIRNEFVMDSKYQRNYYGFKIHFLSKKERNCKKIFFKDGLSQSLLIRLDAQKNKSKKTQVFGRKTGKYLNVGLENFEST